MTSAILAQNSDTFKNGKRIIVALCWKQLRVTVQSLMLCDTGTNLGPPSLNYPGERKSHSYLAWEAHWKATLLWNRFWGRSYFPKPHGCVISLYVQPLVRSGPLLHSVWTGWLWWCPILLVSLKAHPEDWGHCPKCAFAVWQSSWRAATDLHEPEEEWTKGTIYKAAFYRVRPFSPVLPTLIGSSFLDF